MTDLQTIHLAHSGKDLVGRLAIPEGSGPHPVVLVYPSALGLGEHALDAVQRLAEAGYLALGVDMYGDGIFSGYTDTAQTGALFMEITANPDLLRSRINAWVDHARTIPGADPSRIAAIGYCFGGLCVLELARSGADVAAVVSYHGVLKTSQPAEPGAVKAEVVAYCGGRDPYAPLSDIDALRDELAAAGASYQITTFGSAPHSFTDPRADGKALEGVAYDAMAARMSWSGTMTLFNQLFGS